jgi:nitronate monooxygenase
MPVPAILQGLRLPVVCSPMFIVSSVELVIAQCKAGVVGSFPSLNARPEAAFGEWLTRIAAELAEHDRLHPDQPSAPFAVNLIAHRSNVRLDHDLAVCVEHKVPIVITSLGAREDVNQAIHSYGGIVLHDVINNKFARKAIEKGADGLIAVAAGAGGHTGAQSPFALIQEIREWFDGPLLLSGAIANGNAILAAQAAGADLAYIGSAFIATEEANAAPAYKQMVVDSSASQIVLTNFITGVHGNYLRDSLVNGGLDPDNMAIADPSKMDFSAGSSRPKAWKDIWGAGQGVGAVKQVMPVAQVVARLQDEYRAARQRLGC